jgi:hypothetical protein
MREYTVPGLTVQQLISTHAQGRKIRAVQIDVEGLDDMVGVMLVTVYCAVLWCCAIVLNCAVLCCALVLCYCAILCCADFCAALC